MKHSLSSLDSISHISDISFCECVDSPYIKPRRMIYKENGVRRTWDFIESLDSVAVLLYHQQKDSLLFVKQFRPAVFVSQQKGYTYELCAGLVDKEGKTLEQIACEEVYEECGYHIQNLQKITEFGTSVGNSGAKQTLFYATITEDNKISQGGGIDGEVIETIFIKIKDLEKFLFNENIIKTPGLGFGIMWFLNQYPLLKKEK